MLFDGPTAGDATPGDRGPLLANVAIVMSALSCLAVLLRIVGRKLSKTPILMDDILIVIALHAQLAALQKLNEFLLDLYVYSMTYNIGRTLIKFSILLFVYRVFHVPQVKWSVIVIAIIVGVSATESLFLDPLKYYWSQAIPSILTDISILFIPLPSIWGLSVTRAQKLALSGTFILGGFVAISSIIRLVFLVNTPRTLDFTFLILRAVEGILEMAVMGAAVMEVAAIVAVIMAEVTQAVTEVTATVTAADMEADMEAVRLEATVGALT
ncbi:hypothetical protein MMC13_003660 [Lambiella insularis]|nr:hypothetical protein [Lambiella insularis]